jgi:lipoprotein-anchoring transpeptidase ErfK/SrfK
MYRLLLAVALACAAAGSAWANVVIVVDKSQQRMSVAVDGKARFSWPVSTARAGYRTPNGVYHPEWLARKWYSTIYHHSPMPYSIFFDGGFAIHGSYETGRLGSPASHGCIRLHPAHAATLFALVQEQGTGRTEIVVTSSNASGHARMHAGRHAVIGN